MKSHLITEDEIRLIKTDPKKMSWKDKDPVTGLVPRRAPLIRIKSGYVVDYTIDSIFDDTNVKLHHVTIASDNPDPAEMDIIAHAILGDCFRAPDEWLNKKDCGTHYGKITGIPDTEIKEYLEAGIQRGATMVVIKK